MPLRFANIYFVSPNVASSGSFYGEQVDKTYCMRKWGVGWHHCPWQLYGSTQQAGQCRLWDRARPYSLSTCRQPICSICSSGFWGLHEERLFLTCVYFLFPAVSLQFQALWINGLCPELSALLRGCRRCWCERRTYDLTTRPKSSSDQPPCKHDIAGLSSDLWRYNKQSIKLLLGSMLTSTC